MITIGLIMGIYNEAGRIADCLDYHLPYVDKAVIVCQESDDGTEKILDEYAKTVTKPFKILHFPKMGSSEATIQDGVDMLDTDWVLYVDADEKFPVEFLKNMHKIVEKDHVDGYRFERHNFFDVPVFNQAVPIEPKTLRIQHPAKDSQVRLTRRSISVFPRQIHCRVRVRDENGHEEIRSVPEAIFHLKSLDEQWNDNNSYLPEVRLVNATEKTKHYELYEFPRVDEGDRGSLVFGEVFKNIPFPIRRVFWVFGTREGRERGGHANKKNNELLICLQGSVRVLLDDGKGGKFDYFLAENDRGLFIKRKTWVIMKEFAKDTILLCLASEDYNLEDRISDYNKFLDEPK